VFLAGIWDTYKEDVSNNSNVGTMYGAAVNDWYDRITGCREGCRDGRDVL